MNAERLLTHYEKIADAPNAIPRLRRFILDLAVRGKLVEQDPNDEPASELLKRIASEKARLVKAEVFRRPKVPVLLSGDELSFHLPGAWAWTQIAELGVISPRNDSRDDHVASFVSDAYDSSRIWRYERSRAPPVGRDQEGLHSFCRGRCRAGKNHAVL